MKSYPTCDVVNPMGAIGMVDSITSDPVSVVLLSLVAPRDPGGKRGN